ncbi:MAG: hypothetical protein KO463_06140 [Candidatus Methanofastidiosa archaeon]|nr:hypothetical protein [Candidatus Methanofastidiosa archaeon]
MEGLRVDADVIEDVFLSIRPYLSDTKAMQSFLETHASLSIGELASAVRDAMATYEGTRRTDFSILLTALEKHVQREGGAHNL